jgi:hypothetical protein
MSTNTLKLEAALATAPLEIRRRLAQCESMSSFELVIRAEGRVHDGDIKITYTLGDYYGAGTSKGGRLEPVIVECLRRYGWVQANEPTCLTFQETSSKATLDHPE